jgi:hypothetical protein
MVDQNPDAIAVMQKRLAAYTKPRPSQRKSPPKLKKSVKKSTSRKARPSSKK